MWLRRIGSMMGAALLAALLAVLLTPLVQAGGWATVTLDELPREPQAGETLALGFTIRQHGFREVDIDTGVDPVYLFITSSETGETVRFDAIKDGNTGHFLTNVTFPVAGEWRWGVRPGYFPEVEFEPLTVLPAASPTSVASSGLPAFLQSGVPPWRVVLLAITLLAGAALVVWLVAARQHRGLAVVVAGLCLVLAAVLLVLPQPADATGPAAGAPVDQSAADQISYGRALFVAKGCTGCHVHASVSTMVSGPVIGPDLTRRPADAQFLKAWLADPAAVRVDAQMPNLGLDGDEIEALIAFLTAR